MTEYGHLEPACPGCGRTIADPEPRRCPHCDAVRYVRLDFRESEQYNRAVAAVRSAGLLRKKLDPGGGIGPLATVYMGLAARGSVWVDADRVDEAVEAMTGIGVQVMPVALPIVDRAEPQCPSCGNALDMDGPTACPACGTAFQWIDIDEPDIDPTGMLCQACEYDLTGNTEDRCPECGFPIGRDLDQLVDAATAVPATRDRRDDDAPTRPSPSQRPLAVMLLVCVVIAVTAFTGAVTMEPDAGKPRTLAILVTFAAGFGILALLQRFIRAARAEHTSESE